MIVFSFVAGAEDFTTNIVCCGISSNVAGPLTIGAGGSQNYLEINSGGSVSNGVSMVGSNALASGNTVLVTDSNSIWHTQGTLTIAYEYRPSAPDADEAQVPS